MTHKNIVRYYQAWVEGGSEGPFDENIIQEEDHSTGDELEQYSDDQLQDSGTESENDGEELGWWTNSPTERHLAGRPRHESSSDSSESSDTQSWSSTGDSRVDKNGAITAAMDSDAHSSSMTNMLEHENNLGLDVSRLFRRQG